MPETIVIPAADGYPLGGCQWRHARTGSAPFPVAIINPATSVRGRYYSRFADYLHAQGWDVLTYDYRGIGESRRGPLRRLRADWIDWGTLDFEGVLRYAGLNFPEQPIDVIGHSVGGFIIGLAPSAQRVRRIFTMGAQFAYWRDYQAERRRSMFLKWHVLMPFLATLLGHVPAKRLGWMEDTPKGVALDWARMAPRFEDSVRRGVLTADGLPQAIELARNFRTIGAPILALGTEDDPFGTEAALDRLLKYYSASQRSHLRISPRDIGLESIGHFAFFHERFRDILWPYALEWLRNAALPAGAPGRLKIMPPGY
ncbi:alpha/beta fold hydrolase [Castellaniella sp.]|uniref:alpha/beta hydrolase family protein n=1 Tax=Castellaniella sp. TaxID=1955812 RepID=UPI002D7EDDED|nr:alpha/beta fold hydrolase [Castellaniella sp.]HET8703443.1 alpha/beta fold hydrolase [Castellaniella sp.]